LTPPENAKSDIYPERWSISTIMTRLLRKESSLSRRARMS